MKAKFLNLFKRDFLINQLMQLYSALLVIILLITMFGISLYIGIEKYRTSMRASEETVLQLKKSIVNRNDTAQNIFYEFYSTPTKLEAMLNYVTMEPMDYFNYIFELAANGQGDLYFPDTLSRVFISYPEIESIDIVLDEVEGTYLHGDRLFTRGQRRPGEPLQNERFTLFRPILGTFQLEPLGEMYITFSEDYILGDISTVNQRYGIDSFVFAPNGKLMYQDGTTMPEAKQKKLIRNMADFSTTEYEALADDYYLMKEAGRENTTIITALSKKVLWLDSLKYILLINGIGIVIIAVLLIILNKTFKRYSFQVGKIVEVTKKVSQGQLNEQIDTSDVQLELKDLAEAINQMMDSINQYIEDVYSLEIKQRDAHMRALQSQINPHFLYNTLEYIRMYALSQKQEELADVVFAFSALLRNNTTQEKTTTLQAEVDFCEKYVYLYQMRYPDKIAYHVTLEADLKDFVVPKFIIQPLIENYFVHGIDYNRGDNAISIKAYREAEKVVVKITDNGKGVSQTKLASLEKMLTQKEIEVQTSIGIVNVYERLRGFFGKDSQMLLSSNPNQGFTVKMIMMIEEGQKREDV